MHELGIMVRVLERALQTAEQHGGGSVAAVKLRIGVLSGVLPSYLPGFFQAIAAGTSAENARLELEIDPACFLCADCGGESVYDAYGPDFICVHCGGDRLSLRSGTDFQLVSVAVGSPIGKEA